jgi:hypothetical protein
MGCGFGRIDADPIVPRADPLRREGQGNADRTQGGRAIRIAQIAALAIRIAQESDQSASHRSTSQPLTPALEWEGAGSSCALTQAGRQAARGD